MGAMDYFKIKGTFLITIHDFIFRNKIKKFYLKTCNLDTKI